MKMKSRLTLVYSRHTGTPALSSNRVEQLHPAIQSLITRHQLHLAPVCSHSRFATLKPLCEPTNDLDVLASAAVPDCNWVARIGTALIIVEINFTTGRESLALLSAGQPELWSSTLQFDDGTSRFLFFRRPEQRVRFIGSRFTGVRLYLRESGLIQLPPSWFVAGPNLRWIDPDAAILAAPSWLLDDHEDAA